MTDIAVIEDPAAAVVALDPVRSQLLAELAAQPASAAGLAARVGLPRQRVGYHLTALEEHGLVVEVDQRRHGGLTERVLAASAPAYVVSPGAMGAAGTDPARVRNRLSAAYLVALAARAVREAGRLLPAAERETKRLPTLSVDVDLRLRSAQDRAAFTEDLGAAVRSLAGRYHDESAHHGRWYRVVVMSYPRPDKESCHE